MSRTSHQRTHTGLISLTAILAASAGLFAAKDPALLPDGRESIEIRTGERNPFSVQIVQEKGPVEPSETEGLSEEARIRRILGALRVTGASLGPGRMQAMLGSMIVRPGDQLPPLIQNQSERLNVLSFEDGLITLAFVERDPSAEARRIVIPVKMKPTVTQFIFGEAVESLVQIDSKGRSALPALDNPAVIQVLSGSQKTEVHSLTERDVNLMGVVQDAKAQDKQE